MDGDKSAVDGVAVDSLYGVGPGLRDKVEGRGGVKAAEYQPLGLRDQRSIV